MIALSVFFFIAAVIAIVVGCGWTTGKPVRTSEFIALILAALLIVSLFSMGLSVKLACPNRDEMLDWSCVKSSIKGTF